MPGATRILGELAHGPVRRRVGLRIEGRIPLRADAVLSAAGEPDRTVGRIVGWLWSSVGGPIALAYVAASHARPGMRLEAEIRGQRIAAEVTTLPFIPTRYHRG